MIDDPTRSTAHGFWRFSADYLLAARAVDVKLKDEGRLFFPTLHLYGLAIELSLKAFLLKRGVSLQTLRRDISHSLTKALTLARRHKLGRVVRLSRAEVNAIRALDLTYSSNQLRYIVTGSTKVPQLVEVTRASEQLGNV
jgi:hypothetical protein